jgi:hypothetical protein
LTIPPAYSIARAGAPCAFDEVAPAGVGGTPEKAAPEDPRVQPILPVPGCGKNGRLLHAPLAHLAPEFTARLADKAGFSLRERTPSIGIIR